MSIWTGLLFLEGAVADAGLACDLAQAEAAPPAAPPAAPGDDDLRAAQEALAVDRLFSARGLR